MRQPMTVRRSDENMARAFFPLTVPETPLLLAHGGPPLGCAGVIVIGDRASPIKVDVPWVSCATRRGGTATV